MTIGITAYSAYVPRYRLARRLISDAWGSAQPQGEIAVGNYDEDALTMAVEAASACVGDDASGVDGVYFAGTSAPYAEKQIASIIATACDVLRRSHTADFAGSGRAGVSALLAAFNAVRAGTLAHVAVAAADARLAAPESDLEGLLGDAGAGAIVGRDRVIAEIVRIASISEDFTHVWRTDGDRFVQAFPGRFSNTYGYASDVGEAVRAVLKAEGLEPRAVAKLAVSSPDVRAAADLAKQLGFDAKSQLVPPAIASIGSAGTADPLLALAAALDDASPGDWIVVAGYGEGADAILLRATEELPKRRAARSWKQWLDAKVDLPSYAKYLKLRRILGVDATGEAINNVLEHKEMKQDVRLYGSRCRSCGTVQYPIARVCLQCKGRDCLDDHKLRKTGNIFTFTVDHLIANVEHPLPMAVVDMEGGGRLYLQVTDFEESEVGIGNPMQLTFRRLHEGGGKHNYFWKARPVR
jgi:3-hydroxy-3-methylglutaryl CoA synthase